MRRAYANSAIPLQFVVSAKRSASRDRKKCNRFNSPFRDLIPLLFLLETLADSRSPVMAGLDPAIQS
jgi:hypothetical protein